MLEYNKEKLKKAIEKYSAHSFWGKQYKEAPSKECKDYLEYTFYSSCYYDPDAEDAKDFDELQEKVENKLAAGDWEYLKNSTPNGQFRKYCEQRIKELAAK